MTSRSAIPPGSCPPPYPYDRLERAASRRPSAHDGGVRRPVDRHARATRRRPPWSRRWPARAPSGATRRRSASPALREAAAALDRPPLRRRRRRRPRSAACIGTKEFVGRLPHWLRLRDARPRHGAVPGGQLPDLRHGRDPGRVPGRARARSTPVAPRPRRHRPGRRRAGAVPVGEHARQPDRRLDDLGAAAAWGRAHGVPVFSDECYVEFTWDGPARTILEHGLDGVVAVHSLSKRSNLAGVRVGFYAGDPDAGRLPARGAQARRVHGARARCRPPRSPPWPTTTTSTSSASATGAASSGWRRSCRGWAGVDAPLPGGGFYLWPDAGRRLGLHRPPGRGGRRAGEPRRVLRRRRSPATCASPWCNPTTASSSWPSG